MLNVKIKNEFPRNLGNDGHAVHSSMHNGEKIFNDVILEGSCHNAGSLTAVVGRCPALGVTVKALLGEFPQVLFFHWHRGTTRHEKNLVIFIDRYPIAEELACKIRKTKES